MPRIVGCFGGVSATGAGSCRRRLSLSDSNVNGLLRADIDVPAGAAALFFNFREIGALVPVGFGVIIVGDVSRREFRRPRGR